MKKDLHLTDEALLELAGDRLSHSDRAEVKQHLDQCLSCRERFASLKLAHSVFERLAEVGLGETLEQTGGNVVARPQFGFSWSRAVAIGLVCAGALVFLLSPWAIPGVRASELLNRAVKGEDRTSSGAAGFLIKVQGKTCASGRRGRKVVQAEYSDSCSHVLQQMRATAWASDNFLSARTYSDWRSSLHKLHDSVERQENLWRIQTTTDEGPVRTASLEMRASDYHATKLTLDFDDEEQVSISETVDVLRQPKTSDEVVDSSSTTQALHALEEANLLEAKAWAQLHELEADTGWEAIVLRNDRQILVKAFVETDERRQQIITAFAPYPAITLEIHSVNSKASHKDVSPQRASLEGYAPGLAEAWLEMHFPDADARMEYSNNVLSLSQHILGRAFFLDRLRRRQTAMESCSCSGEMAALIVAEQQVLSKLQADLSQSLEPLIGASTGSPERTLSLAEARDLDTALEELFSSSSGASEKAFDMRLRQVRRLL